MITEYCHVTCSILIPWDFCGHQREFKYMLLHSIWTSRGIMKAWCNKIRSYWSNTLNTVQFFTYWTTLKSMSMKKEWHSFIHSCIIIYCKPIILWAQLWALGIQQCTSGGLALGPSIHLNKRGSRVYGYTVGAHRLDVWWLRDKKYLFNLLLISQWNKKQTHQLREQESRKECRFENKKEKTK